MHFRNEDFSELRYIDSMSSTLRSGASRLRVLDERANEYSIRVWQFLGLPCLKGILGHFAEFGVGFKLLFKGLKSVHPLEELVVQIHIHRTARDAKILEFTAEKEDVRLIVVGAALGRHTSNHAIRGYDIEYI